jgi:hypothetical protein
VEFPSLARWTLRAANGGANAFVVAPPTKRRVVQAVGSDFLIYDLPEVKGDLGTWLDDRTNAIENPDGLVSWPWLHP